jgi:hypothetical protein
MLARRLRKTTGFVQIGKKIAFSVVFHPDRRFSIEITSVFPYNKSTKILLLRVSTQALLC